MRLAPLVSACLVVVFACSDPRVAEDRAAACSNDIDDDADGLVDCDDPDCAGTDACEKTSVTCANSVDDDRDGALDCRQESCRALPVCKDAVETSCLLLPAPTPIGCPRGKGCYLTTDGRRWCALEGAALAGSRCGEAGESDRSRGCAARTLCNTRQRCALLCIDDYDCPRNSRCREEAGAQLCSASCLPGDGCDAGEECVAYQRRDVRLAEGGWVHECMPARKAPPPGTVTAGGACADYDVARRLDETCAPGLLCIPSPDGARCRRVCGAPPDGSAGRSGCTDTERCLAVVPFSGQPRRLDESYGIGVCIE